MNDIETRCMTLARQYCELNLFQWPDDYPGKPENWDNMTEKEKYENGDISTAMRHISKLIEMESGVDSWYITNYYWNCYFRENKLTPEEWIEFAFFRSVMKTTIDE